MPDDVVVGEHPGLRCADGPRRRRASRRWCAQVLGEPWRHQELEVERLVQLVAAHVAGQGLGGLDPGLRAEDAVGILAGSRVLVGDLPPAPVDVVHAGLVPHRRQRGRVGVEAVLDVERREGRPS